MRPADPPCLVGWDIGGAHVKACLMRNGQVLDVAQWACPLWQGLTHLSQVLHLAHQRWPQLGSATHAATMTGEMTDLFEHREDGVRRIAALLADSLAPALAPRHGAAGAEQRLVFFAGAAGWVPAADAGPHWQHIASANWMATAQHAAQCLNEGVLVDIGSTTTDLIAFRKGKVLGLSQGDAQRLATGELVYHGVVRTPLCALGPRVAWQGRELNVMNEFFATTADVYRLTGELAPDHDLHPSADNGPKDLQATRRRLARMIGLDARDAPQAEWRSFAHAWRARQVAELGSQLRRVMAMHGLSDAAVAVSAGCGSFLVPELLAHAGRPQMSCLAYGQAVAKLADAAVPGCATAAQVCAPSVAVASLYDRELR